MKRLAVLMLLLAIPVVFSIACGQSTDPVQPQVSRSLDCEPPPPPPEICGEEYTCLMAGQHTNIGDVKITNDGTCLTVEFITIPGWTLGETHVAVADTFEGIPQTKSGSPKVGNFPYVAGECIDVSQWAYGTTLYIAAHAEAYGPGGNETAWGCGDKFAKSWAMYFTYTLEECCKDVSLPDDEISAKMLYPGDVGYYKTYLYNVPGGYNVANGFYVGWCVDQFHYLTPNHFYDATLYSTVGDVLPVCAQSDNWDLVNYLLNHKHPDADKMDIQHAIWYFIGGDGTYPSDPEAQAMVEEAMAEGEGFCPQEGDWIAVLVFIDCNTQLTIIEVDP